jgi:hypothetical protein
MCQFDVTWLAVFDASSRRGSGNISKSHTRTGGARVAVWVRHEDFLDDGESWMTVQTQPEHVFAAALLCFAFVACGDAGNSQGATSGKPTTAFYSLHADSVSESCSPPRATGDLGEWLVFVAANGANIPIVASAGQVAPPRQDVPFAGNATWDAKVEACPMAVDHFVLGPITTTQNTIVVPWKETWQGVAGCQAPAVASVPASDCASERVLTFSWLRPCPPGDAGGPGVHCD